MELDSQNSKSASELRKGKGGPNYFQAFIKIYEKDQIELKDNLHELREFKVHAENEIERLNVRLDEQPKLSTKNKTSGARSIFKEEQFDF